MGIYFIIMIKSNDMHDMCIILFLDLFWLHMYAVNIYEQLFTS